MKKVPSKLFPNIKPCWKCGQKPIIIEIDGRLRITCQNPACNNFCEVFDSADIESAVDLWNEIYNCEPFIPKNVHYLNTCNRCIHRINCIFTRSLDSIQIMSITCNKFELDNDKEENKINIEKYIEQIRCYKKK